MPFSWVSLASSYQIIHRNSKTEHTLYRGKSIDKNLINVIIKIHMHLFQPEHRQALLINSLSEPDWYSRLSPFCDGNERCYEMEYLLSWTFGGRHYGAEWRWEVTDFYGPGYEEVVECFVSGYPRKFANVWRQNLHKYESEIVFPDELQDSRISQVIEKFRARANNASLTLVYAMGHGTPGVFWLAKWDLPHATLLDRLDRIPWKKVLIISSCYSGSILDVLDSRDSKNDFSVLTTSRASQQAVNRNDEKIHQRIVEHLANQQRLSTISHDILALQFEHMVPHNPPQDQKPQSALNFDVIL